MKPGKLNINRRLQVVFALIGGTALCFYWQSWRDVPHLFYDIPAGLTISAYIAQILLEGMRNKREGHWWARVFMLLPMSVVPIGREFFQWHISGHLTDILAAAMIQTADKRLRVFEKILYWLPIPVILYICWFVFDTGGHRETYNAMIVGIPIFLCFSLIRRIFAGYKRRQKCKNL